METKTGIQAVEGEQEQDTFFPTNFLKNRMTADKPTLMESSDIRRGGSSSLVLTLTHAFRELGLDVGDFVKIETHTDRIIIRMDETKFSGKTRVTYNIDPLIIDKFNRNNGDIEAAIRLYNTLTQDNLWEIFGKVVEEHESESENAFTILRNLIENHISKWTRWYRLLDRPLLRVGTKPKK